MDYKLIPLKSIPSPEDKRDYPVSRLVAQVNIFSEEFEIPYSHDILNQGQIGSCVSHSIDGYCRSIKEEQQSGKYQLFSVGFRYGMRESTDWQGEGLVPREALNSSLKYGSVPYSKFPYNLTYPEVKALIEKDKSNLLTIAQPYKISAYCRLYTIDEIKNALIQLGMVTAMLPVYDSFYQIGKDGLLNNPNINNEKFYGNHQVTINGWRKDGRWKSLNSWGNGFGDNGKFYPRFDFPFIEFWSITDNLLPHKEVEPKKQLYWRCQLFAFKDRKNADKAVKELTSKGYKVFLVEKDGLIKLQLGAFTNKNFCMKLADELKQKGYKPYIVQY